MSAPPSQRTGRVGERLVQALYEALGWVCIDANYRAGPKEIDLVVHKARRVAFIEVKTRSGVTGGAALDQVGPRKIARVTSAARHWIHHRGVPGQRYQFDVAGVYLGPHETRITVVHDAWRLS